MRRSAAGRGRTACTHPGERGAAGASVVEGGLLCSTSVNIAKIVHPRSVRGEAGYVWSAKLEATGERGAPTYPTPSSPATRYCISPSRFIVRQAAPVASDAVATKCGSGVTNDGGSAR